MATLSGRLARVKFTSSAATTSTGEACTRSTGTTGNGYVSIDSTAKRHWDRNTTAHPTLYLNSTAVAATNYDVNYVLGRFEWLSGDPSTGTYTADVAYVTASHLVGARSWNVDADVDMLDVTTMSTASTGAVQWRSFEPGLSQASVTLDRLVSGSTAPTWADRLTANQDVIVELVISSSSRRKYEGYGWVASDGFGDDVGGLASESVNITVDGQLYYSTV